MSRRSQQPEPAEPSLRAVHALPRGAVGLHLTAIAAALVGLPCQAPSWGYVAGVDLVSGRQFVLVVAGGHGSLGTRMGDHVIAYALPRRAG